MRDALVVTGNDDTSIVGYGGDEQFISMTRLGLIIDLYHYFPIMRK
jgi:hypothetical protein